MQNPQPLPIRTASIETDDPDALGAVQPERKRRYDQLRRGRFRGELIEVAWGAAAIQRERWSCGVRVRSDRPGGYVAFAVPSAAHDDVRWCGIPLTSDTLIRSVEPWDISSSGSLTVTCFAVDAAALEAAEAQLAGGEPAPRRRGNRCGRSRGAGRLAARLQRMLRDFDVTRREAAALAVIEADLLHLAATLDRAADPVRVERLAHPSRRRVAVRGIEEYLDAFPAASPSVAGLCGLAGVSERTLEYAFRQELGTTPIHFLKTRRLNQARRTLRAPEACGASVNEIALRCGFSEPGRFAGEYRGLFGERPSETLAATRLRAGWRARPRSSRT